MSLAVPASYSEYIFDTGTRQADPAMVCNGGIMPLRTGAVGTIDNVRALRGEDVFFLMEAVYARHAFTDYAQSPNYAGINCEILESRLESTRDKIVAIKDAWQASAPSVSAHDFGTTRPTRADVTTWMLSQIGGIGVPAVQGLTFAGFRRDQMMYFFADVKKLNYSVDVAGRNAIACDTSHTVLVTSAVEPHWPDEDTYTTTNFSVAVRERYVNGDTTIKWSTEFSQSPLKAEFSVPVADDFARVVDVRPFALVRCDNDWSWENTDHGTKDDAEVSHWVLIPADAGYLDITGGGVFLNVANPRALIDLAFNTAGLQRDCDNIAISPDTRGHWNSRVQAIAAVEDVFSLIHFKYCNLEGVQL